jgi:hypothetical protein
VASDSNKYGMNEDDRPNRNMAVILFRINLSAKKINFWEISKGEESVSSYQLAVINYQSSVISEWDAVFGLLFRVQGLGFGV